MSNANIFYARAARLGPPGNLRLPAAIALAAALAALVPAPLHALSMEEAMNAALENDSTLADARSNLAIAENALFRSAPAYGSSLSLSGTVKGSADSGTGAASPGSTGGAAAASGEIQKSVTASLAVPLAKWLSLGVSGSTDLETSSTALSVSLSPFAKADTQAKTAWQRAGIQAESAVRQSMLSVRREYRAVLTAKAEYAARAAAVTTAQNALSKIQYLVELGKSRKSEEISAYSDLMDAQGSLDTAENNLASALQNLSLRTGLSLASDTEFEAIDPDRERVLADSDAWYERSADIALARLSLESQAAAASSSLALPDLSIGTSVDDTLAWSVTAKVSLSPDLFFQKAKSSSGETLAIQRRAFETAERNVKTAYANQSAALSMSLRNYENAQRFVESARLSFTETKLLLERGEAAQASLDSASEKLLSAEYQLAKAAESLENARDQLDTAWQLAAR